MPSKPIVDFRGTVGEGQLSTEVFTATWREIERTAGVAELQIASAGGYVMHGLSIHSMLARSDTRTEVLVEFALSAASIVAMAGQRIRIVEDGVIMIHNAELAAGGNAQELREAADMMDRFDSQMAGIYARRTKLPESKIREMMAAETWLFAEDAVRLGFADSVVTSVRAKVDIKQLVAKWTNIKRATAVGIDDAVKGWNAAMLEAAEALGLNSDKVKRVLWVDKKYPGLRARMIEQHNACQRAAMAARYGRR